MQWVNVINLSGAGANASWQRIRLHNNYCIIIKYWWYACCIKRNALLNVYIERKWFLEADNVITASTSIHKIIVCRVFANLDLSNENPWNYYFYVMWLLITQGISYSFNNNNAKLEKLPNKGRNPNRNSFAWTKTHGCN